MPDPVTLATLLTRIRYEADAEHGATSLRFPDAELTQYLNDALRELRGMLVEAYGADYYMATHTIPIVSGTSLYALPADFFQLLDATLLASSTYYRLRRWHPQEHAHLANLGSNGGGSDPTEICYALRNVSGFPATDQLELKPTPAGSGWSLLLRYIPAFQSLGGAVTELNGYNGWEAWAVLAAAVKVRSKDEEDASLLIKQMQRVERQIRALADRRDEADGFHVVDVRGWEYGAGNS